MNEFVSTILSTVAARSLVGQGISCFSPRINVGGDDYLAFYFFGQLVDGLLRLGWVKVSEVEALEVNFYSFVREQRQMEQNGSLCLPITDVFSSCRSQPGFCCHCHLCLVSIWFGIVWHTPDLVNLTSGTFQIWSFWCVAQSITDSFDVSLQIFQLTALVVRGPVDLPAEFSVCPNGVQSNIMKSNVLSPGSKTSGRALCSCSATSSPRREFRCPGEVLTLPVLYTRDLRLTHGSPLGVCVLGLSSRT